MKVLWIGVWLLLFTAQAVLSSWVIRLLRERHPEAYERIGAPGVFGGDRPYETNWKSVKFVWSFGFRELDDAELTVACVAVQILTAVSVGWILWPVFL